MHKKATFSPPVILFQRLQLKARQKNSCVAKLASRLLDIVVARQEQRHIQRTYTAFEEMRGMGGEGNPQASTSIDELLYGEQGAWRGEPISSTDRETE